MTQHVYLPADLMPAPDERTDERAESGDETPAETPVEDLEWLSEEGLWRDPATGACYDENGLYVHVVDGSTVKSEKAEKAAEKYRNRPGAPIRGMGYRHVHVTRGKARKSLSTRSTRRPARKPAAASASTGGLLAGLLAWLEIGGPRRKRKRPRRARRRGR